MFYIIKLGDHNFSWALMRDGQERPVASGLSRVQAEELLKKHLTKEEKDGHVEQAW